MSYIYSPHLERRYRQRFKNGPGISLELYKSEICPCYLIKPSEIRENIEYRISSHGNIFVIKHLKDKKVVLTIFRCNKKVYRKYKKRRFKKEAS